MSVVAIPDWNSLGLLPPVDSVASPTSAARSPYPVSLKDVVMRFSTTPERRAIVGGFLRYRAVLREMGLVSGFQWLDGSFMEDVETLEQRAPNDIDVVSFVHVAEFAPGTTDPSTLMGPAAKVQFKVDAYFVELDALEPRQLASLSAYWYSMWAHRRNHAWKGYLQVELAADEDADAMAWLIQNGLAGASP